MLKAKLTKAFINELDQQMKNYHFKFNLRDPFVQTISDNIDNDLSLFFKVLCDDCLNINTIVESSEFEEFLDFKKKNNSPKYPVFLDKAKEVLFQTNVFDDIVKLTEQKDLGWKKSILQLVMKHIDEEQNIITPTKWTSIYKNCFSIYMDEIVKTLWITPKAMILVNFFDFDTQVNIQYLENETQGIRSEKCVNRLIVVEIEEYLKTVYELQYGNKAVDVIETKLAFAHDPWFEEFKQTWFSELSDATDENMHLYVEAIILFQLFAIICIPNVTSTDIGTLAFIIEEARNDTFLTKYKERMKSIQDGNYDYSHLLKDIYDRINATHMVSQNPDTNGRGRNRLKNEKKE